MKDKKQISVVAAIVVDGDKHLCMQRTRSKYDYISEHWEFPGGKVERGESHHATLLREIKEEMDWDIYVGRRIGSVRHDYPDFSILLTGYLCRGGEGDFKLLSHLDYEWLTKEELSKLNWTEADRKLIALL